MSANIRKSRPPALVDHYGAQRPIEVAALGALAARSPGCVDGADEVNPGVRSSGKRDRDLALAWFVIEVCICHGPIVPPAVAPSPEIDRNAVVIALTPV
jgi:hypothetical protein